MLTGARLWHVSARAWLNGPQSVAQMADRLLCRFLPDRRVALVY